MVSQKYRWDFIGLSTDEKPTSETSDKVVNGSTYYCSDTSKLYVYCNGTWYERKPLGGGGGGGTSDFNDLSNRPKYNGSVMTGSTNIPEVVTYSDFTGTDGTAAGEAGLVPAPATTDAGKFLKADGTWDTAGGGASYTAGDGIDITNAVISATNTGEAKVLTTDDYNYPTNNPDGVALWQLEPGVYSVGDNVSVYLGASVAYKRTMKALYLVGAGGTGTDVVWAIQVANENLTKNVTNLIMMRADGSSASTQRLLNASAITNSLTSKASTDVLSAAQGKVLKDLVDSLAVRASGAPTTSTVGQVGTLYEDTTNGKLYICTDTTGGTYTWAEVGAGGSGPTVVQTAGTSTTDVMSQNAVTSMVFNDPSTRQKISIGTTNNATGSYPIAIGYSANTGGGNYSVALGYSASATTNSSIAIGEEAKANAVGAVSIGRTAGGTNQHVGAVALGAGSAPTANGQMDIGSTNTYYGYNSSNYRLLTGLYDPQSAHDAATKGYVDGIATMGVLTTSPTGTTVGVPGRLYTYDTGGGSYEVYLCVHDNGDNTYVWKQVSLI